jgi:hypothetical protein
MTVPQLEGRWRVFVEARYLALTDTIARASGPRRELRRHRNAWSQGGGHRNQGPHLSAARRRPDFTTSNVFRSYKKINFGDIGAVPA